MEIDAGKDICLALSGLEYEATYVLRTELVSHCHGQDWLLHIHFGNNLQHCHQAISDTVLELWDYTHCSFNACPGVSRKVAENNDVDPQSDLSSLISFKYTPDKGRDLFVKVSGKGNAAGVFKLSLSRSYIQAGPACGQLSDCATNILEVDPCALGGCVGLLSGTVDVDSSGDAGESEISFAVDDAAASDDDGASEAVAASDDTAATDSMAGPDDSGATDNGAAASDGPSVVESTAVAESAVVSEGAAASDSADAVDSAVVSGKPDQPSNTHRSDSTSQPDNGSQPEQPTLPTGDATEEIAPAGGEGGLSPAGLVIAGLVVVLAAGMAGIFAVWKMRWSGR
jgi:hypothetical protein